MGKGLGLGHGPGCGQGDGDVNILLGSSFAVGCTVLFCACGLPMLLAGIILIEGRIAFTIGISLVVVASVLTVIAVILIIFLCTGSIPRRNRVRAAPVAVVTSTSVNSRRYNSHPGNISQPPPYTANSPPPYSQVLYHQNTSRFKPPVQPTSTNYDNTFPAPPPQPVYPPPNYERY